MAPVRCGWWEETGTPYRWPRNKGSARPPFSGATTLAWGVRGVIREAHGLHATPTPAETKVAQAATAAWAGHHTRKGDMRQLPPSIPVRETGKGG